MNVNEGDARATTESPTDILNVPARDTLQVARKHLYAADEELVKALDAIPASRIGEFPAAREQLFLGFQELRRMVREAREALTFFGDLDRGPTPVATDGTSGVTMNEPRAFDPISRRE